MTSEERAVVHPPAAARKWINAGPDEGALHVLLDRVTEGVPRERIDTLWIFPHRLVGGVESTVMVVAAFDDDPERRTVATAHFRVNRDRRGRATVALQMQEHGTAPVGATQRVVDGVLRRMGDEVGRDAPRRVEIGGALDAWSELYVEVGGDADVASEAGSDAETVAVRKGEAEADSEAEAAREEERPDRADGVAPVDDESETPPHGDLLGDAAER